MATLFKQDIADIIKTGALSLYRFKTGTEKLNYAIIGGSYYKENFYECISNQLRLFIP